MDFYTDSGQTVLTLIDKIRPMPEFVKSASIFEPQTIPDNCWAWPEKRAFSIADPASTYLSFGYWLMDQQNVPAKVKDNIVKSAAFFGIGDEVMDLAKRYADAKRRLDSAKVDSGYALPGKYPLHTMEHVAQAVEYFPRHYKELPIPERMIVARKIVKEAKSNGVPIMSTVIMKYAKAKPLSRTDRAGANIAIRMQKTADLKEKKLYNKLGQTLAGNVKDSGMLFKVAGLLERMDKMTGLDRFYGTQIKDAFDTVFNMNIKEAQELLNILNINGKNFLLEDLANIPADVYEEAMGEDFLDNVKSQDGLLDINKLKDVINALPAPDKNTLVQYLEQYIASSPDEDSMTELSDEDWEGEEAE